MTELRRWRLKSASLIEQPDNYADANRYQHGEEESSPQLFTACLYKGHGHSRMNLANDRSLFN
jgi:hypothetical protein